MNKVTPITHTVLERKPAKRGMGLAPGEIVLVHLGENTHTPYVTWFWNEQFEGYAQGHYFSDLSEALADYLERE